MRLRAGWIGKTKYGATAAWTEEYLRRMTGFRRMAQVTGEELAGRDPQANLRRRAEGARLWLLDPAGKAFTSPRFADFLVAETSAYNQELVFAVGGADGFDAATRALANGLLSLSPLTLSHELARLVLLEQMYRALAILTGHPYPH